MAKLPNPANYPASVYVTNESYRIVFSSKLQDFGICDPEKKTITIKSGMSDRETFNTLVHELLHAIEFEHGLKIKHKMIYKLEKAIVEMLVDNFL